MRPLTPAEIDDTLVIGGEDIDARKVRSRMTVAVRVNGQGPYRFVVDSGADSTVIGRRVARELQLPAGDPAVLNTMTESRVVERALLNELKVGPSSVSDLVVPVLEERHIGGEGMIGLDALAEQRLMMDFDKRTISVDDATTRARSLDGEIVVTARMQRGQLILTQASAQRLKVAAVIDTGSEITIGNIALRDKLVKRRGTKLQTVEIT
ncbi:MAG: retropepsin-like aspartic protease, partial [Tsuneonella sp.]